ncbi:MAG: hypothetical protein JWL85_828, partial [Candidatus Saccharibacteria bacterium]|nr:hypothetical protein [Candidatus Saccharibacteria bacterium]
ADAAKNVQVIIGGNATDYEKLMRTPDTRYVILAKKLSKEQSERIEKLEMKGVGTREAQYRTYPQGSLAAQVLGFVNDDNEGKYGLEQFLNTDLQGKPGLLKAITDAQGVPLASNKENMQLEPTEGKRVVLTLDIGMQQQLEDLLQKGLEHAKSDSGSALIMDPNTGAVKAMANYPTYNPGEFSKVEDGNTFNNSAVSSPLEVGSIMKPLTTAAALDLGAVNKDSSYFDPGFFKIDDAKVTNVEEVGGAAHRSVKDILLLSLNTGATWLLMQMGGGQINDQARTRWHDYMTDHYMMGKETGIEQGYESGGTVPDPHEGFGLNIQFANTAFGQGMSATPLQMASAISSVLNGGTYYKPHLIEKTIDGDGKEHTKGSQVVRSGVVKPEVGATVKEFMEGVVKLNNRPAVRAGYSVGGKTGTAQITKPTGGYYDDRYNGMYMGFVGGDKVEYVIVVRVNEPKIGGYAGSKAAAPIFASISNMLIDNYGVTPRN